MSSSECESEKELDHEPHAMVIYRSSVETEEPVIVHFSFIQGFSINQRKFEKARLYKVFWSPDSEDSPDKMKERVSKIPEFKPQEVCSAPGYYRATIQAVADSRKALIEMVGKKRMTVVPNRGLFSSFDESEHQNSTARRSNRIPSSSASCKDQIKAKVKQEKVCASARLFNKKSVRTSLSEQRDFQETKVKTKSLSPTLQSSTSSSDNEDDVLVSPTKVRKLEEDLKIERLRSKRVHELNLVLQERIATSDESRTQKLQSLNVSLQEKLINSENHVACLEAQLKHLSKQTDFNKTGTAPVNSKAHLCEALLGESPKTSKTTIRDGSFSGKRKSEETSSKLTPSQVTDVEPRTEFIKQNVKVMSPQPIAQENSFSFDSKVEDDSLLNTSLDDSDTSFSVGSPKTSNNLSVETSSGIKTRSPSQQLSKSEVSSLPTSDDAVVDGIKPETQGISAELPCDTDSTTTMEEYILYGDRKVPADVLVLFSKIPAGHKNDLKFVKSAAVFIFGPEVLAASTVLGSKKGGNRSKSDDQKEANVKAGLDKTKLAALKDFLKWRINREPPASEKETSDFMSEADRLSDKRIGKILNDKQKTLRLAGYGKGIKSNDLSVDSLRADIRMKNVN